MPIAGGEVLTRRQSFQPWLEAGAFDIVQPDVTKVGGISEERRIAWMAQEHGVRFIPHGWNTAVGLAADLQLASAFPDTDLVEYLTGSPFIDEIAAGGWHLDADGMLAIPDKPGLGIEIDLDALAEYSRADVSGLRRLASTGIERHPASRQQQRCERRLRLVHQRIDQEPGRRRSGIARAWLDSPTSDMAAAHRAAFRRSTITPATLNV